MLCYLISFGKSNKGGNERTGFSVGVSAYRLFILVSGNVHGCE
jgi:hypothetical protein